MDVLRVTQKTLMDRTIFCKSLLNGNKIDEFLKRLVTGDEKCGTHDNVKRKR